MKILIKNSDNVVYYAGADIALSASGASGLGWRDPAFNTANATLADADLPANWTGGVWTYIAGVWAVLNTSGHAAQLAKARAAIWESIKATRDRRIQTAGYTTGGKWYHSDTFSRTQQMGLSMMGALVPAVQWKTMNGSFVTMSQTLAASIFSAASTSDQTLFSYAETLRTAVYAAADPASVNTSTGWPTGYTS